MHDVVVQPFHVHLLTFSLWRYTVGETFQHQMVFEERQIVSSGVDRHVDGTAPVSVRQHLQYDQFVLIQGLFTLERDGHRSFIRSHGETVGWYALHVCLLIEHPFADDIAQLERLTPQQFLGFVWMLCHESLDLFAKRLQYSVTELPAIEIIYRMELFNVQNDRIHMPVLVISIQTIGIFKEKVAIV